MYLRFGNLTVNQFADRVGAVFTDEEIETLEAARSHQASVTDPGQFHIFDDPALVVTLGRDAVESVLPIFAAANDRSEFTQPVSFYPVQTA